MFRWGRLLLCSFVLVYALSVYERERERERGRERYDDGGVISINQ